ncbi:ferredoxin [Streptomyces sp. NPDC046915]|uniref:ferredoxin n=1 Tax=Streptomyces sp. NPDC046915 TaxID=3155257 RepID=UPI0033F569A8
MLQVVIDKDVCVACGACVLAGPDVFDQNEDGQAIMIVDEPDESLRDQIEESIDACPVQALKIVEPAQEAA